MKEKRKLLLIDDDEVQLAINEELFKNEYELFFAKSGKEALEYLYKGLVPNMILLDILMPNMDGWETFNRIRAISLLKKVPIVFLTSLTTATDEKHGLEMGAADYIKKPINQNEIQEKIQKLIGG